MRSAPTSAATLQIVVAASPTSARLSTWPPLERVGRVGELLVRALHLRVPDRALRLRAVRHALEAGGVRDRDGLDHRQQRDLLRLAEQRHALLRGVDRQVRSVTCDEHMHDPVLHAPATIARHHRFDEVLPRPVECTVLLVVASNQVRSSPAHNAVAPGCGRTRIPPAAADRRIVSSTSMLATPSAKVGTGTCVSGSAPSMRARKASHSFV